MLLGVLRRSIIHKFPKPFNFASCTLRRMAHTLPKLPLFEAIAAHDPNNLAVIHSSSGRSFKYGGLLSDVAQACNALRHDAGNRSLAGERIAFLVENGYDYVGTSHENHFVDSPRAHRY